MTKPSSLQVDYLPRHELERCSAEWWQDVLALVHYDGEAAPSHPRGIAPTWVTASLLGDSREGAEVWRLPGPMSAGELGRLRYRRNGRLMFASLSVFESEFAEPGADAAQALRAATRAAYRELFEAIEQLGFPHPLRIWHFLPDINGRLGEGERYWHFNSARQSAFLEAQRSIAGDVPAASMVGAAAGGPLTIYCIAGRQSPLVLENPRQCSPWAYPAQYGPRSPTFARACIDGARDAHGQTLFISGTSSIVGHESAHPGDVPEQTRETLRNIAALVRMANERLGAARFAPEALRYKAYVRRPEDQPSVERVLREESGLRSPVLYLKADICRRDLLVEIEAMGAGADD